MNFSYASLCTKCPKLLSYRVYRDIPLNDGVYCIQSNMLRLGFRATTFLVVLPAGRSKGRQTDGAANALGVSKIGLLTISSFLEAIMLYASKVMAAPADVLTESPPFLVVFGQTALAESRCRISSARVNIVGGEYRICLGL